MHMHAHCVLINSVGMVLRNFEELIRLLQRNFHDIAL
jgi:hypothetical protein